MELISYSLNGHLHLCWILKVLLQHTIKWSKGGVTTRHDLSVRCFTFPDLHQVVLKDHHVSGREPTHFWQHWFVHAGAGASQMQVSLLLRIKSIQVSASPRVKPTCLWLTGDRSMRMTVRSSCSFKCCLRSTAERFILKIVHVSCSDWWDFDHLFILYND